jgi:superfamily I DNA and/or RNA helicase
MSGSISFLVSEYAYGGLLRPDSSISRRSSVPSPYANTDLFIVDSTLLRLVVARPDGRTRVNQAHVDLVEHLLAELDLSGCIPKSGQRSVAIISPFVGQVRAIRQRLGKRYHGRGVRVTTTHRCQGEEADIVLFDLTDAPGLPISEFLGANDMSQAGPRLINVGLSRARHQLYVIGAMTHLRGMGGRVVRRLIERLENEAVSVRLSAFWGAAERAYPP